MEGSFHQDSQTKTSSNNISLDDSQRLIAVQMILSILRGFSKMNQKITGEVMFGPWTIPPSQIFILRKNVFAIINNKPFVQGHVLVCSRRVVPKIQDLTEIEVLDLFMTAQEVVRKL